MPRLPIPGSDEGAWGTVLNDYLQVAHTSAGAIKADAVDANSIQDGSIAATKLNVSGGSDGQVLTKASGATGGLQWITVASTTSSVYPLSAYGFFTASDGLSDCTTVSSLGTAFFARIFVPAGKAINAIGTIVATAGTVGAGGLNSFGIYDDAGTLVASTAVDNTMWQTTGWLIKTLSSPIAAQDSDRFVYCAASCEGYSGQPNIFYNNTLNSTLTAGGGYLVNNRRTFYNQISSWPASINPATYGNQSGNYLPLIVLG
jgi:hypothetical protein